MPVRCASAEIRRYKKCRPSGRNCGNSCSRSCHDASRTVKATGFPPAAVVFQRPELLVPKIITPSEFQEPPTTGPGLSQRSCASPLDTLTLRTFEFPEYTRN